MSRKKYFQKRWLAVKPKNEGKSQKWQEKGIHTKKEDGRLADVSLGNKNQQPPSADHGKEKNWERRSTQQTCTSQTEAT